MASSNQHDTSKLLTELLYCLKYSTLSGSQDNLRQEKLTYLAQAFGCSTEVMQAALDSVKNAKAPVFQVRLLLGGASGLQNKSVDGPSRPYVTLCLGRQAEAGDAGGLQRSAVREGPQPTWRQTFIVGAVPRWRDVNYFACDLENSDSQALVLNVWNQQSGNSLVRMLTKLSSARRLQRWVKQAVKRLREDRTAGKLSRRDDFLGQVSLSLQDLPLQSQEVWLKLEPRSDRSLVSGEVSVSVSFITSRRDTPLSAQGGSKVDVFEKLLSIFVEYEHRTVAGGWLSGLSTDAMGFLSLYTSQSDVSPFQQSITVWLKYARMHGCGRRVEFRILEAALLDMEKDWDAQKAYERAVELLDSVQHFVGQSLRMLEDLLSSFPPDNPASTDRLTYLLRCVCFVYKSRVCQPQNLPCSDARAAIAAALKRGIEDRYLNLKQSMQNVAEDLVRMLTLAKEMVGAVRLLCEKYTEVFASTCDVPLALIMHQQAGDLLGPDVRATMRGVSDALGTAAGTAPSAHTAETTLRLYLVVLTLRADTERLRGAAAPEAAVEVTGPSAAPGALDALHEWFSGVFWSWFHVVGSKVSSVMDQAVEADTLTPEMAGARHSSSAVDSAKCFQDYCELWQQLRWPHPTKTQSRIVDGISKSAIGYAQLVLRKLAGLGCPEAAAVAAGGGGGGGGGGLRRRSIMAGPVALALTAEAVTTLARQYCIGVNNVELVWASLSALPEQWSWSGLSEAEVETARRMLRAQLHDTEGRLDGPIGDILRRLREMILSVTRTNLLAVGASSISSSHQAIESLSDFLNKTIRVLFETLSNDRFQRLLEELWTSTVLMLVEIVSEKKPRSIDFYSRMDLGAQALLDIYNPSDRGHAPVSLELKEFAELDRELKLKMTQTTGLVVQILQRRCSEQTSSLQRKSFGSLALKCFYDHGRQLLVVEVLNVALPGGDDKGQIRPIVKIRLLPRSTFGDVKARSTRAGERGTHILVDETLSFKVTREQCASPGACALCTVRNHGGLRAALVGEAALALSGVPGVLGPPVPDPRSVPQVALALLHPRPSDAEAEILAVLLGRASDSEAQEFAKAYRAAESQCLHPATSP